MRNGSVFLRLSMPFMLLLDAIALKPLWGWFVSSTSALPTLSVPVAAGITMIARLLVGPPDVKAEGTKDSIGKHIARPVMAILVGFMLRKSCCVGSYKLPTSSRWWLT